MKFLKKDNDSLPEKQKQKNKSNQSEGAKGSFFSKLTGSEKSQQRRPAKSKKKGIRPKPSSTSKVKVEDLEIKGINFEQATKDDGFERHIQEKGSYFDKSKKGSVAPSIFKKDVNSQSMIDELNARGQSAVEGDGEEKTGRFKNVLSGKPNKKAVIISNEMKQVNSQYSNLTFKMYSYKIFNWALQGEIDKRNPNLNGNQIQIGYSTVFTKTTATRYYFIHSLPEDTPFAFYNYLKESMRNLPFWNKLHVQLLNEPFKGDLRSPSMQMKVVNWESDIKANYAEIDDNFIEGVDGTKYVKDHIRSEQLKFTQRMLRSYFKLTAHAKNSNETVFILKIQTLSEENMLLAESAVLDFLDNLNVEYKQVRGKVLEFLRSFSIISNAPSLTKSKVEKLVMTNRDLAAVGPLRQGKIGKFGLPFGIDKLSGLMIWLDLLGTSDAKNIFITGITGAGKTFFLSYLLFFAKPLKIRQFIEDEKGTEFRNYTLSNGGVIISQTASKMSYVNKWVIPTELATSETDLKKMYTDMVSMAQMEFMAIVDPEPHEKKKVEQVFSEFMKFVHASKEIEKSNPKTYYLSKGINPQELYRLYEIFADDKQIAIHKLFGTQLLRSIQIDLHTYWNINGGRSELYINEVDIETMCRNDIVTFDMGKQESIGSGIAKENKLKLLNYETACSYYKAYNKKLGLTTIVVKEEIQSVEPEYAELTAKNMSQGRSQNIINIVLGNASGVLFQEGNVAMASVRENFTVLLIGKVTTKARELYVKEYGLQKMSGILDAIATETEYKRCFLLHSTISGQEVTAVTRMLVPEDVAESPYFKTVDHTGNKDVKLVEERL